MSRPQRSTSSPKRRNPCKDVIQTFDIHRRLDAHVDHLRLLESIDVTADGEGSTLQRNVFVPVSLAQIQREGHRSASERQGLAEREAYNIFLEETGRAVCSAPQVGKAVLEKLITDEETAMKEQIHQSQAWRRSQKDKVLIESLLDNPESFDDVMGALLNESDELDYFDDRYVTKLRASYTDRVPEGNIRDEMPDETFERECNQAKIDIQNAEELQDHIEYLESEYYSNVIQEMDNIRDKAEEKYRNECEFVQNEINDEAMLQEELDFLFQEHQIKMNQIKDLHKAIKSLKKLPRAQTSPLRKRKKLSGKLTKKDLSQALPARKWKFDEAYMLSPVAEYSKKPPPSRLPRAPGSMSNIPGRARDIRTRRMPRAPGSFSNMPAHTTSKTPYGQASLQSKRSLMQAPVKRTESQSSTVTLVRKLSISSSKSIVPIFDSGKQKPSKPRYKFKKGTLNPKLQRFLESQRPHPVEKPVARTASEKYLSGTDVFKLKSKAKQDYIKQIGHAKQIMKDQAELAEHLQYLNDEYESKLQMIYYMDAKKADMKAKYLADIQAVKENISDADYIEEHLTFLREELISSLRYVDKAAGASEIPIRNISEKDIAAEIAVRSRLRRKFDTGAKTRPNTSKLIATKKDVPKRAEGPTSRRIYVRSSKISIESRPSTSSVRPLPMKSRAPVQYEYNSKIHFTNNVDNLKRDAHVQFYNDSRNAKQSIKDKNVLTDRLNFLKDELNNKLAYIDEAAGAPTAEGFKTPKIQAKRQIVQSTRNLSKVLPKAVQKRLMPLTGQDASATTAPNVAGVRRFQLKTSDAPRKPRPIKPICSATTVRSVKSVTAASQSQKRTATKSIIPRKSTIKSKLTSSVSVLQKTVPVPKPTTEVRKRPPRRRMILKKGTLDPNLQKFLMEQKPPQQKVIPPKIASQKYLPTAELNNLKYRAKQRYMEEADKAKKTIDNIYELTNHLNFLKMELKAQIEFIEELPKLKKTVEQKYISELENIAEIISDEKMREEHIEFLVEEYKANINYLDEAAMIPKRQIVKSKHDALDRRLLEKTARKIPDRSKFGAIEDPNSRASSRRKEVQRIPKARAITTKPQLLKKAEDKMKSRSVTEAKNKTPGAVVKEWRVPQTTVRALKAKRILQNSLDQLRKETATNKDLLRAVDNMQELKTPISITNLKPLTKHIGLGGMKEIKSVLKTAKKNSYRIKKVVDKLPPAVAENLQKRGVDYISPLSKEEPDGIFKMLMDEEEGLNLKRDPKEIVKLKIPSDAPKLSTVGNAVESLSKGIITDKVPTKDINSLCPRTAEEFASTVRQQPPHQFPIESLATKRIPKEKIEMLAPAELKSKADYIECELLLNSFQVETFFQARGSVFPKWFPGMITAFPEDNAKLVLQKSPSEVLYRAWQSMKPEYMIKI